MKTKLLLLMALFSNALCFAQINVNESFETAFPATWTTFTNGTPFTRVATSGICDGNYTLSTSSTSVVFFSSIQTENYVSSGDQLAVSFQHFSTFSGGNVYLYYEVNNSGTRVQIGTGTLNGICQTVSGTVPATAIPAGNLIRFSMQVNRNVGYGTIHFDNVIVTNMSTAVNAPTISSISVIPNTNAASVTFAVNANNASTTSTVNYGVSSTALSSQVAGFVTSGNTNISGTVGLPSLQPNTQYFYQVEATNSAGTTQSPVLSFTTPPLAVAITEYNFNNTYNDINGNAPFASTVTLQTRYFVNDRDGNALSALYISNTGMAANITGLPVGNSPRTVSVWIKSDNVAGDKYVFGYGTNQANNAYGFSFSPTIVNNLAWANDLTNSSTIPLNVWKHIVCTYDASGLASIYIDGILRTSGSKTAWNTLNTTSFNIGRLFTAAISQFSGAFDDLKIYNRALTPTEITNLFTNNTLTSANFNQNNLEVSLYPNPANDVLNIEMANEVKLIEIYNIQGQKVLTSNQKQINVSDLANGMYMIRIQDTENAVSTKKFMKL